MGRVSPHALWLPDRAAELVPSSKKNDLSYNEFLNKVNEKQVKSAGSTTTAEDLRTVTNGRTTAFLVLGHPVTTRSTRSRQRRQPQVRERSTNFLAGLLRILLYAGLIIGFFVWMSDGPRPDERRDVDRPLESEGVHHERPRTTFNDVAGYRG